jgi:REP element-mobilizing transposase RayT
MARPLRIQYPGAVYHVMARGNHGQGIFQDDRDRQCFLETLGEACEKTGWRIHAYVLMGNHYHLLGHYSRVTQAINRAGRRPGWKLNRIKHKLARLETMNQV